jgi:hypothetical protein
MRLLELTPKLSVGLLAAALISTAFMASGCSDTMPMAPTVEISDDVTYVGGGSKDKKTKDSTTTDEVESMDGGGKYAVGD